MKFMFYCKECLNPSTRPRITFNEEGICNACRHLENKKKTDWKKRWRELKVLCKKYRKSKGFDVIVPCSGGKDGSYVAWRLKYDLKMHPLCVTFSPPIQTALGRQNLENFRNSGFDVIEIRPDPIKYKELCKKLFIEQARCKFPFVIGIGTAVSYLADKLEIPLIIYGEEGETEYGGVDTYENVDFIDWNYYVNYYHEGIELDDFWWKKLPKSKQKKLDVTWWSKWENWDDKLHADLAKEKCGLQTEPQVGTFTDYSQLDDYLQDLHVFEGFIKYGTGRATGDGNLAIHNGRMTREEGFQLIKEKDGLFPIQHLQKYLDFFQMTEEEFWAVIDKHANLEILQETGNKERPYILK